MLHPGKTYKHTYAQQDTESAPRHYDKAPGALQLHRLSSQNRV